MQTCNECLSIVIQVKLAVYQSYFRALSGAVVLGTFIFYVGYIGISVGTNIWLSVWSQDPVVNGTQDASLTSLRLGVYGGLGGALTTVSFFFSLGNRTGYLSSFEKHAWHDD